MIGESIKKRRKSLKVTQVELAEMADISPNTLYKIERNQANPTLDTLKKLGDILGLEICMKTKILDHEAS